MTTHHDKAKPRQYGLQQLMILAAVVPPAIYASYLLAGGAGVACATWVCWVTWQVKVDGFNR